MCKTTINHVKVDTKVDTKKQCDPPISSPVENDPKSQRVEKEVIDPAEDSRDSTKPSLVVTKQPWYKQGGMQEINTIGMGINIVTTLLAITRTMSDADFKAWLTVLLLSYAFSAISRRSLYCIIVIPTFFSSLFLCMSLDNTLHIQPQTLLLLALALSIIKVNICMSVCFHRYAAHSAFKCGYFTNIFVLATGCLAWQGGPIWWASQHRRHHKHCDIAGDPHSPLIDGTEQAFSFFERHSKVDEEFLPNHFDCNSTLMRLIDTWSWVFVFVELQLAKRWFGLDGLFLSFVSGWLCQAITLWFNVVNHPPEDAMSEDKTAPKKQKELCQAADGKDTFFEETYIPFLILDALYPIFGTFVMEGEHKHHHDHARLAKRAKYDIAYWGFVWPLEQMGLVWNVIT